MLDEAVTDEIELYSGRPQMQRLYVAKLFEEESNYDPEKVFIDLDLVAECHIMFEALTATVSEFNASKDNILLSFKD